mmetsp:Transcript_12055/g.24541  ORF Transcript_12055/g.24541 Transcript_12055/m.24541 type:complete len:259 (-) Transcript_12055:801-1577(-)
MNVGVGWVVASVCRLFEKNGNVTRVCRRGTRQFFVGKAAARVSMVESRGTKQAPGTMGLISVNMAGFVLDHVVKWKPMEAMALVHSRPQWWQFLTALFCHASWSHLSGNLFFLLVFGRFIEDERGPGFTWMAYLTCGFVANVVSYLLLPTNAISMGASGAVFGLLTVTLAVRARRFSLFRFVEGIILGQFVWERVMQEARMATSRAVSSSAAKLRMPWARNATLVSSVQVNHIAHVTGAIAGILLTLLVRPVPKRKAE